MEWTVQEAAQKADSWILGGQFVGNFAVTPTMNFTMGIGDYNIEPSSLIAQARNTNSSLKITNGVILKNGKKVTGGKVLSPPGTRAVRGVSRISRVGGTFSM